MRLKRSPSDPYYSYDHYGYDRQKSQWGFGQGWVYGKRSAEEPMRLKRSPSDPYYSYDHYGYDRQKSQWGFGQGWVYGKRSAEQPMRLKRSPSDPYYSYDYYGYDRQKRHGFNCDPGWQLFRDKCYCFIDYKRTWKEARRHCQFVRGALVTISNWKEDEFVYGLGRGPKFWIG